jgi:hypothetical protein
MPDVIRGGSFIVRVGAVGRIITGRTTSSGCETGSGYELDYGYGGDG